MKIFVWLQILYQKLHGLELEKWHRVLDSTMEVMSLMQESLKVLHQSLGAQRSRHKRPDDDGRSSSSSSYDDAGRRSSDEKLRDAVKSIYAAAAESNANAAQGPLLRYSSSNDASSLEQKESADTEQRGEL